MVEIGGIAVRCSYREQRALAKYKAIVLHVAKKSMYQFLLLLFLLLHMYEAQGGLEVRGTRSNFSRLFYSNIGFLPSSQLNYLATPELRRVY